MAHVPMMGLTKNEIAMHACMAKERNLQKRPCIQFLDSYRNSISP